MQFDPEEWGNVAEWVGAVGTAGALLLTALLLRKEVAELRDARTAREEEGVARRRANAMKLRASVVDEGGVTGPDGYREVTVEVVNEGDEPFLNVMMGVHVAPRERSAERWMWWYVAPHARGARQKTRIPNSVADRRVDGSWLVETRFTDDEGVTWHRDHMGALRRVEAAPAPYRDAVADEYA